MGIGGLANLLLNILLIVYNQDIEYHIYFHEYKSANLLQRRISMLYFFKPMP